jgi:hypothetical protein
VLEGGDWWDVVLQDSLSAGPPFAPTPQPRTVGNEKKSGAFAAAALSKQRKTPQRFSVLAKPRPVDQGAEAIVTALICCEVAAKWARGFVDNESPHKVPVFAKRWLTSRNNSVVSRTRTFELSLPIVHYKDGQGLLLLN